MPSQIALAEQDEAGVAPDQFVQSGPILPMEGFVLARDESFLETIQLIHDEHTAGTQHPDHLGKDAFRFECVIESVGIDGIDGSVGKDQGMEIARQDIGILRPRIQIDTHGEIAQ